MSLQVPTWRWTPPPCTTWTSRCSFPVADRSAALTAWAATPDAQSCSHIMMVEADYLFVRGIPPWAVPARGHASGFHFGYVAPSYQPAIAQRFWPASAGPLDAVPQTGNSPQILTREDFGLMMPAWAEMNQRVEDDVDAVREFNWVRDMYAYSFAAAKLGIRHHVPLVPWNPIMVQPPADTVLGQAAILHYTWGPIVSVGEGAAKKVLWSFDKRSYQGGEASSGPTKIVKLEKPPPWQPGMRLQANETARAARPSITLRPSRGVAAAAPGGLGARRCFTPPPLCAAPGDAFRPGAYGAAGGGF